MSKLSVPGHPFQYAWLVPDMTAAIEYWANVVGVGPFFINEVDSKTMEGFSYHGGEGNLQMRVAWAQGVEGQIELIEVNSTDPNVYHDLIGTSRTAFHHIGIWSDDYEKDVAAIKDQGFEVVMDMGAMNICYFDTSAANGSMLEVIERNPGIVGLFDMIRQAATDWDGTNPARSMADLMG
jgi:hypothetical protein